MTDPAYIALDENQCWTLYSGDGSEDQRTPLAVGRPFEPGAAIRAAVAELEAWARDNGFEIITPRYSTQDIPLESLIEPEVFDEVFGSYDENSHD